MVSFESRADSKNDDVDEELQELKKRHERESKPQTKHSTHIRDEGSELKNIYIVQKCSVIKNIEQEYEVSIEIDQ